MTEAGQPLVYLGRPGRSCLLLPGRLSCVPGRQDDLTPPVFGPLSLLCALEEDKTENVLWSMRETIVFMCWWRRVT